MSDALQSQDTVLVVVPVRNRPRLVVNTLDALLVQVRPPTQLVVVDDGSTDGGETLRAVESWIRDRTPSFDARLLRREHGGISAARNAGLAAVRPTDWVAFLDSDDLWPPDFLARCLAACRRAPDAVAVTADQRFVDEQSGEVRDQDASRLETEPGNWLLEHEPCLCSASLLRADLVRARGGFDVTLRTGEDIQLLLPLTLCGRWLHAPGAPVVYRRGAREHEDVNNSYRYDDKFRRWARIYDTLLRRPDLRASTDRRVRAARLWYFWYEAGEELYHQHRRREALPCFARALRYRKRHRRTWSRWAKCRLPASRSRRRRHPEGNPAVRSTTRSGR